MKKFCLLSFALYIVLTIWADNYKILQLNTPSVKIGNTDCKKGDVFSDKSEIHWTKEKLAIKAQNLKTKEIKIFVESEFQAKGCKTIKDYYIKTNKLSSRGGGYAISDLLDEISDTLYLCDSIVMEAPVKMDSIHYFYIVYGKDGNEHKQRLNFTDQKVFFTRTLFDDSLNNQDVMLNLLYRMPQEEFLIKDSLTVILIPWE